MRGSIGSFEGPPEFPTGGLVYLNVACVVFALLYYFKSPVLNTTKNKEVDRNCGSGTAIESSNHPFTWGSGAFEYHAKGNV